MDRLRRFVAILRQPPRSFWFVTGAIALLFGACGCGIAAAALLFGGVGALIAIGVVLVWWAAVLVWWQG